MTKLRTRGAPVDYTDFLSPAAKALPGRGGKRKAWEDDEEDEDREDAEEEEEELVVEKKKKEKKEKSAAAVTKKAKTTNATSKKRKDEEDAEEELEEERMEVKAKPKTKAKASQRPGEREEDKPKAKSKVKNAPAKAREVEYEATTRTMALVTATSSRVERTGAVATSAPLEIQELRKKYEELREFRESETERLLKEAKDLAKEEKRTYEKLVAKLKNEITAMSSHAQQAQIDHNTRVEELQTEHKLRVETLKREREDSVAANERLRRQIKELEGEAKRAQRAGGGRQAISRADAAAVARTGDNSVELSQAKKLLELYRLVTSTELRLIETLDDEDDDQEPENYTDVACAVVDSVTGKRFTFDLAVPHDATEEVEYVPSETTPAAFKPPSYLQEELSFKRSELTKFMRTLLDVVIRKKAADGAKR